MCNFFFNSNYPASGDVKLTKNGVSKKEYILAWCVVKEIVHGVRQYVKFIVPFWQIRSTENRAINLMDWTHTMNYFYSRACGLYWSVHCIATGRADQQPFEIILGIIPTSIFEV